MLNELFIFISLLAVLFSSPVFSRERAAMRVGIDVMDRSVGFQEHFGEGMIHKHSIGHTVYHGVNFNESFGIEFGHSRSKSKDNKSHCQAGDTLNGDLIEDCVGLLYNSEAKFNDTYLDLKFYKYLNDSNLGFFGGVGVSLSECKINRFLEDVHKHVNGKTHGSYSPRINRIFKGKKKSLRLSIGTECFVTDNSGFRFKFTLINTDNFPITRDCADSVYCRKFRATNTLMYSFGTFVEF